MERGKTSMGRQKIEMRRIEKENARQVCFSKRRTGSFKKASVLAILCGAEVGCIAFSPTGKVFSFGHPSVDEVVDRFLASNPEPHLYLAQPTATAVLESHRATAIRELHRQQADLRGLLEGEKKKREAIEKEMAMKEPRGRHHQYWEAEVEGLSLEELREYKKALVKLRSSVARRADQLQHEAFARKQQQLLLQHNCFVGSSAVGFHGSFAAVKEENDMHPSL